MSITDHLPYDARSLLQVQMRNYDRAIATRMPMIQQHFTSISIMNLIRVTSDDHPPGRILLRLLDDEGLAKRQLKA